MTPKRDPQEQQLHDLAVRRICRSRFTDHPEWEVFANPGDSEAYALDLPDGRRLVPDIVARPLGAEASCCIAEVETESTVTETEAQQWAELAALGKRFLLFVPAGKLLLAREICHRHRIQVYGFRVYELTRFWIHIREFRT